jgi:chromosome segregation ATPase
LVSDGGSAMQNFIIVCIAILLLAVGFLIFNSGLDYTALVSTVAALPPIQQVALGIFALASIAVIGAVLAQSDRVARQRKTIADLAERLNGIRQSTRALGEEQTNVDLVLQRVASTDPEEALTILSKTLTESERAALVQQSHNEAVDMESRAEDIRRRQQALRARLGEVFDKRRLVEPIFAELKERQSNIERSLQDFEKGDGQKSLESHLTELTDFVRLTEDRFQALDQGLVTLDRIKSDIKRLQGRIAPLESIDTGIKHAIQEVSRLRDQLDGAVGRLEQDGDHKVSQRVQELADKTREFDQRVVSLCDHFVTLEAVRTDIGILFTRLNMALATHAAPGGPKGQEP